jgi:hypothetical protein
MVSTSFPREILVHESTELGCCWGGRFGIRITTSTNVEDDDENENRANDIEIALARPKQTRLRRRPEHSVQLPPLPAGSIDNKQRNESGRSRR